MKKLLLSLILFFVFTHNTSAQNSLSLNNSRLLSLDEILRIYPYHNESIDFNIYPQDYKRIVESAFVNKTLRKTLSYKLTDQVISQIKYDKPDWTNNERRKYEYNSENQLIRITTQKWNGANWVDWMKTEYTRTESGAIGSYVGYTLTNGSWTQSNSTTYIYDGQGNNTGYEYETFGSFPTRMKTLNTTDANGKTILSESFTWNSATGQYTKTGEYNYTYNAQGKQTESIYKTNSNGTLVNSNRTITEYNGDGTTKKTTSYSWNSTSGSWTQGNTTEYAYYPNSTNQAEAVTKNNSGVPTQRLLYTYSGTNKILTNETQTWDNSMQNWNPWWRTDRTYTSDDYTASLTRNSYTPGKGYEEYDRELYEYITVETATKVRLTTSVFPPAAEQDGSTVTPSGTTEYNKNTKVTLDAKAGDGWVFEKWTGNLTGTTKPQDLTMDDDKNVIANFQPLLTLSLSSPNETNLCPPALNEELLIATAGIFVDGVDWLLTGISFTATEKYKPSYTEAWIEYAGNKLKGKINVDADSNATSYTFSPTQHINEGTTLSVKLILKFMYPSKSAEKYIPAALTEVKKYKVSIQVGQVTCIPIPEDARPGVKGPIEVFYSNKQTMASVWNVSKQPNIPFATINDAVESSQTLDNELIKLCPGWFVENVIVNKALTIFSAEGYEKTVWECVSNKDQFGIEKSNSLTLTKSNSKVFGIKFINASTAIVVKAENKRVANLEFKENYFTSNLYGIRSFLMDSTTIHHNTWLDYIEINHGKGNIIEKNDAKNEIALSDSSNFNIIRENVFSTSIDGVEVHGESMFNKIFKNYFGVLEDGVTKIKKVENGVKVFSNNNLIEENIISNTNDGIEVWGSYNTIKNNIIGLDRTKKLKFETRRGIVFASNSSSKNSNANIIEDNVIAGCTGNAVDMEKDCWAEENIFRRNIFGSNPWGEKDLANGFGFMIGQKAKYNTITENTFGAHLLAIMLGGNMNEVTNNKFGTDPSGTKEVLTALCIGIFAEHCSITGNLFSNCVMAIMIGSGKDYATSTIGKHNFIQHNKFGMDITGSQAMMCGNGITIVNGSQENYVENNIFGEIRGVGVMIGAPGTSENYIQNNFIGYNPENSKTFYVDKGIWIMDDAERNIIYKNTIGGSSPDSTWAIILYNNANKNLIRENYVGTNQTGALKIPNRVGIFSNSSHSNTIVQNKIWYNYAGIHERSSNNYLAQNDIRYNTGNTGIHLEDSKSQITGNTLANDDRDAIKCERGSNPIIAGNNIFDNKGFGLNNADPSIKINAQGNYWGTSNLTISGNVNASNPLTSLSKLICVASLDTLFLPENGKDSVSVFYKNWNNANDKLAISITCDKPNWLTSAKNITADLSQPNSGESKIKFALPAGTIKDEKAKVIVKAISQSDQSLQMSDTITVLVYKSVLSKIVIRPDSTSCNVGDTLQLSIAAFDQHLNNIYMPTKIDWQANGGTMMNDYRFIVGSREGIFIITAKVNGTNITATAKIKVGNLSTSIESIEEKEIPAEYYLYQNYPNPFNPETTIKYDLPRQEYVTIKIYDILGREVITLVNKEQSAGKYEVIFNTSKYYLASGIYICRLNAGNFSEVRKMLLLK